MAKTKDSQPQQTMEDYLLAQLNEEVILKDGVVIYESNTQGYTVRKQHPLCGLLYQQEMLCLSYAKALGGTAAKAAAKPEDKGDKDATNALNEFIDGIK